MRAQAQELARITKALKEEIQKQEYFDGRTIINDFVQVYSNDAKDYVHVMFNKGEARPVEINIHQYGSYYSESFNIDMSITDAQLDEIVERSQTVVDEFIQIYKNRSEEIKQQRIAELEKQIAILRGDVSVS